MLDPYDYSNEEKNSGELNRRLPRDELRKNTPPSNQKIDLSGYQFTSASSYNFTDSFNCDYKKEETKEALEEANKGSPPIFDKENILAFVNDTTLTGLLSKFLIVFTPLFFVLLYSVQNLLPFNIERFKMPHKVMLNVAMNNYSLLFVSILVAGFLAVFIMYMLLKTNKIDSNWKRSERDTHGSAKFATDEIMAGALTFVPVADPQGIVVGHKIHDGTDQDVAGCVHKGRNQHVMCFGSSGAGKSYSFARPNILSRISNGDSFFVTDPSGELYRDTAAIAEQNGFTVKVLNLKNMSASSGWNPFKILQSAPPEDVQIQTALLVHTILANTKEEGAKVDAFFDMSEENLLKALILYVAISPNLYRFLGGKDPEFPNYHGRLDEEIPEEVIRKYEYTRHIGTVYDLITKLAAQEGFLEEFEALPDNDPAKSPWKLFQGAGKLKTNFITGLASRLEIFQTDMVQEVFSHDEIDLSLPGKEKCAYYLISSVSNDKMKFLLSLFFSCAFETLITDAENSPTGKLDVPVYFILDEFKAIGQINSFANKLANVRKYGMSISMIFQDLNQLFQAYPLDYKSIISNCDTWVALNVNDNETAKFLSERSGISTAEVNSKSESVAKGTFRVPAATMNVSTSDQRRNLLNPDEILTFFDDLGDPANKQVMVFARNKPVYFMKNYGWPLHHLAKYVGGENTRQPGDYLPDWQMHEFTMDKLRPFLVLDSSGGASPFYSPQASFSSESDVKPSGSRPMNKKDNNSKDAAPGGIVFKADGRSGNLMSLY